MTDAGIKELKEIEHELKETWKDELKSISDIETKNPQFKSMYNEKSNYIIYIEKQGRLEGISFAHKQLEDFLNKYK